jgi:gas vesicle protein
MSQLKVTIYEAKETIVTLDFPCCYRTNDDLKELHCYYRFTDQDSYTVVRPYMYTIRSVKNDKFTNLTTEFAKLIAIQDEIFEQKLDETMEAIQSTYEAVKNDIEKQYDTDAQRDEANEAKEQQAWDNHRNH